MTTVNHDLEKAKPRRTAAIRNCIFVAVEKERHRQDAKWGEQNHEDDYWLGIVMEEIGEVAKAVIERDLGQRDTEIIHAIAVLTGWAECINRRGDGS